MENEILLILLASLCGVSASAVFSIPEAIAFKPVSTIDSLYASGEVPVCGHLSRNLEGTDPYPDEPGTVNASLPESAQQPQARDILCNVEENNHAEIRFVAHDNDPNGELTASIQSGPSNGQLSEIDQTTGTVTYRPNQSFVGEDKFTYSVNGGTADSNVATVTLNVVLPPG